VLASIFDPVRRFLFHPQLAWMLLWVGLAFLIIALVVMIRTSWGQSHPLRKCVALSLLAHLLLLCYATTVQIVTANGNGHQGGMSLLLVDGGADGSDVGADDGPDRPGGSVADAGRVRDIVSEPAEAAEKSTADASQSPTTIQHSAPPLLEVATPPSPPAPEKVEEPKSETVADQSPTQPPAKTEEPENPKTVAKDEPPPTTPAVAESPNEKPDDKPPEPLPSDTPGPPLAKLPDPPTTSDVSQWVAGDPSAASATSQSAPEVPTSTPPADLNAKSATEVAKNDAANTDQDKHNLLTIHSPQAGDAAQASPANSPASGAQVESATAPIANYSVPQIYSDRVSPERAEIGRRRGGSPGSESAVQTALHWLALHQNSDGRWDAGKFGAHQESAVPPMQRQGATGPNSKADTAITGLALLAMLGAGNTHLHGDYSQNVQRGLEFLLSSQGHDGNLAGGAETYAFMYSHGIATLAMSEAYAMTGDARLRAPVQAAINYTLGAQIHATGGWRYKADETPGERGDTSQLGWQLMSLKSAQLAGLEIPPGAADGAVRFIKSVSSGQYGGKASYRPGERPTRPMTAEALVCRQFLGMARDNPAGDEAGEYLLSDVPRADRINLYYWYYGTLGMYQLQGDGWQRWNAALQSVLVDRQRTDGDMAGSWDPECIWGGYGGRVYSTALSSLCLEVYYRYLPLYQAARPEPAISTR
jgi:hypothetical protein